MTTEEVLARRQRLLTGERTSPGVAHEAYWFTRHEAAYTWVADRFGPVSRACDAGSGEGYGTACLRTIAEVACGVELDSLACAHAASTYPDTCVVRANLVALPLADAAFDLLTSMQVIEHLWDVPAYLGEILRVLAPGGHACISTPNRPVFSPGLARGERPANPFHVQEFDAEQLAALLKRSGLVDVQVLGLVHGPRIADWEAKHDSLASLLFSAMGGEPSPEGLDVFLSTLTSQDYQIREYLPDGRAPIQDLIAIGRAP